MLKIKGSYGLIFENLSDIELIVGSLGKKFFSRGVYVYIGSAFGENQSIETRVNRHASLFFSGKGSVHWHVDYLIVSDNFDLWGYSEFPSQNKNECDVASEIDKVSDGSVDGFGCTDCGCDSHLFFFDSLLE